MSVVGRSVPRLEDRPLVTGRGRFAADVGFPHMLHMRVVRSAHAHGRIVSIDASAARAAAGRRGDLDLRRRRRHSADRFPADPHRGPGALPPDHPGPRSACAMSASRSRRCSRPTPIVAEDAADLVAVTVEELPVILDASATPGEFEDGRSTEPAIVEKSYGDLAAAFRDAHAVVELDLAVGRHSGVPMETRGAIARHDAGRDVLEMYGAAKVPHWNRDNIARMLGRDPSSVHLFEGHVGGGFGIRGELYPEDVLVCLAALRLGRPVKWIEDRREHLIAANHSRQQRHKVRAAVDAGGRILAIDDEFFHDQGGYVRTHAATVPDLAAAMLPGPYRVPAYRALGHVRLTNKTPGGTYRAPGTVREHVRARAPDGRDRGAARDRSHRGSPAQPHRQGGDALQAAAGDAGHRDRARFRRLCRPARQGIGRGRMERAAGRACGSRRAGGEYVGAGLAIFVEKSGLGPFDGVRVSVDTSGFVEVVTGAASLGQGVETVVAQICADALGVDYRRVRVVHGRTDRIAFGMGAFASRVTVMTGEATRLAAVEVRNKAIEVAAELLQQPADALDVVDGKVVRKGAAAGPSMTLGEIAKALEPTSKLRGTRAPGLAADGWFYTDHMNYPYGVHIAVVKVDRETGGGDDRALLIAYDVGRAVNPMLVEGQIAGGLAQGIGGALARGIPLRRARRAVVGQFRRLPDADRARGAGVRRADHRGCADPAQSARTERGGGGRRQSRSAPPSPRPSTMRSASRAQSPGCR